MLAHIVISIHFADLLSIKEVAVFLELHVLAFAWEILKLRNDSPFLQATSVAYTAKPCRLPVRFSETNCS